MWLERFRVFTRTSIWRFTLIFTLIVLLICTSILALVYQFTVGEQKRQVAQKVTITAQGFSDLADSPSMTLKDFKTAIEQRIKRSNAVILVLQHENNVTGNLNTLPTKLPQFPTLRHFPIAVVNHLGDTTVEIILGTNLITPFGDLSIGLFDKDYQTLENNFIKASIVALTLALFVTLISGFLLNRRVLSKVKQIAELTAHVKAGRLKSRLPISAKKDEFDMIAEQINQMLDEIDDLLDSVSQVTNNIAHDLRTPLSRIRIAVEDSIDNDSVLYEDEQWKEKLLDEIDNVMHTFNAMLELSRLEQGVQGKPTTSVDISALCQDVFELAQPLAEEKEQQFTFIDNPQSGEVNKPIQADGNLLFRAIYNLVENAIKYTPRQGSINLQVNHTLAGVEILVTDNGPGIPKAEHEAVFKRLYRLDTSRQQGGFGLGLSIVKAITELHGGKVLLTSLSPGLSICLSLPRKSA
jgi:signal transduction histidine kinase